MACLRMRGRVVSGIAGFGRTTSHPTRILSRCFASVAGSKDDTMARIRNLGILAHIDAGKTTTTERMLFYSGVIRKMGEVHDGDTVMDFSPQERARGITINSAAISFPWQVSTKGSDVFQMNLIDTPGHVDFTIEVERSVRVLDGAVVVLDAVAGVEAQTEKVWHQANVYNLPRLCFVNKLDRDGANFERTVNMLESRLGVTPLVVQLPEAEEAAFDRVIDVVTQELITFSRTDQGQSVSRLPILLDEEAEAGSPMANIAKRVQAAREALLEQLSDVDDIMAEKFILEEDVSSNEIEDALRRVVLQTKNQVTLVFCGSALKNIGIQPLLDGVVKYLPSPEGVGDEAQSGNQRELASREGQQTFSALAFKVKHDRQRGPIVFFRIYAGNLRQKQMLYNVTRQTKERMTRLMNIQAGDFEEVETLGCGDIGAMVGLKHTKTGDTLVLSKDSNGAVELPGVPSPEPVFSCSIEAQNAVESKKLAEALHYFQLEDPSFHVSEDLETGQTLMHGMGELHLEVMSQRLMTEYALKPTLGPMQVAYRESIQLELEPQSVVCTVDHTLANTERQYAQIGFTLSPLLRPLESQDKTERKQRDSIVNHIGWKSPPKKFPRQFIDAMEQGLKQALMRGPSHGYQLAYLNIELDEASCHYDGDSNMAAFQHCAIKGLKEALEKSQVEVLEPVMTLETTVPEEYVGDVLTDLNAQRRAAVSNVETLTDAGRPRARIEALVPLSKLVGYATTLRSKTRGEGDFHMSFSHYDVIEASILDRQLNQDRLASEV